MNKKCKEKKNKYNNIMEFSNKKIIFPEIIKITSLM